MPKSWLPDFPIEESEGSRRGEFYHTADGTRIYNQGQRRVTVATQDGNIERGMTFQIADVDKALGSVKQIVNKGNKVVFDQDAKGTDVSYILNKITQERMPLRVENGVYVLDLVVAPPRHRTSAAAVAGSSGFTRQG